MPGFHFKCSLFFGRIRSFLLISLYAIGAMLPSTQSMAEGHPFYVSIVEIHVNEEAETLECSIRMFTDDLERSIRDQFKLGVLNLGAEQETNSAVKYIEQYLRLHFKLKLNQERVRWKWIGKEGNLEHQWVYVELPYTPFSHLEIQSSQLMSAFPEQRNLVHFYYGDFTNSIILKSEHFQTLYP